MSNKDVAAGLKAAAHNLPDLPVDFQSNLKALHPSIKLKRAPHDWKLDGIGAIQTDHDRGLQLAGTGATTLESAPLIHQCGSSPYRYRCGIQDLIKKAKLKSTGWI
jgi:hypothetical protein